MVAKMMRWRPWPPLISKKLEVRLVVRRLENLGGGDDWLSGGAAASVEIGWKGPPRVALSSFRRTVKRNCTKEEGVKNGPDGAVSVEWDEAFQNVCNLTARDNAFHPWEISFTVFFNVSNQGAKNKVHTVGTATLNLAEFAARAEEKEFSLNIPLAVSGNGSETRPALCICLSLLEEIAAQEPITLGLSSPRPGETSSPEKDELSALKAGLRKVKIFTEYVSVRRAKKPCREEDSSDCRWSRSEEGDYAYPFDTESLDGLDGGGELEEGKGDSSPVRNSFSYGTLAYANFAGSSFYSNTRISAKDEDLVYYSNRRSDVGCSNMDDEVPVPVVLQNSKRSILPWRKRKLSFRSPKGKGEPLLKKNYWEDGGDDIDYDRRQLSSDESISFGWQRVGVENQSSLSGFCDDSFTVGSWEQKDITSRDGHMMLQTQVFFASIDQRSEQAAGESACTALVAVIADWLQTNRDLMPVKSQFDSLIREGSLEWRNLCENETYRERFPDKHFDLETVLQAKIRPISVVPSKSFVGFFHPDGMDEGRFDFLHGAMSFDSIWDEISRAEIGEPQVYIVSWNDHFFVLKIEPEAYYIIDTLGERLYEGCNQAYILKFDTNTAIYKLPEAAQSSDETVSSAAEPKTANAPPPANSDEVSADTQMAVSGPEESAKTEQNEIISRGKESCKRYIKDFLAAIPIRELEADMKRGLVTSVPLHHRLQIEFHYTHSQPAPLLTPAIEAATSSGHSETPAVEEAASQLSVEFALTEAAT
ncbi:PREDICTED: uncharacterized protein LOC109182027 isoform X2 [Ipomoea nil]|uniref:uncharacterized protein LOC109182027 isoform X2 n=1 Tax=Ipomoea nil TaxID=35883 RepID=UPI000901D958|nr:PREDICTED: uncharacterized protein LOC109182027 isoform X2 [Ipomoea nil]